MLVWRCLAACGGEGAAPAGEPGPAIEISEFKLSYGGAEEPKHALYKGHPGLPKVEAIAQLAVTVGKEADGYVAPRAGLPSATFKLAEIGTLPVKKFYASGLLSVEEQVVTWFNRRKLVGIFVAPHPEDLVMEVRLVEKQRKVTRQEDRRPANRKDLRLVVWTGVVTQVRTIASGDRVPKEQRVDNPAHARIKAHSPVRPAVEGAPRADLLDKGALERYTSFLSRHPGRRVDVALASADRPGGVVLDYLVNENKPWYAYVQASNTGTHYTRPWRERFGFVHNQLTGHDDILTLDYDTAGFDAAHAVNLSYEVPVFGFERLRWRVYGSWSKYTASDIGQANAEFRGEGWSAGTELAANVFQHKAFFVDAVLGARWDHLRVDDKLSATTGEDDILSPYVGFRFERITEIASTGGFLMLEWNLKDTANTEYEELNKLGRLHPDTRWAILKFDVEHAFYLEPLLNPAAWADPSNWKHATLAHELAFRFRGQNSTGHRLTPQYEMVAGGMYTVRGYPESVVSGDNVYIATAEYRFHVPRMFKPRAEPAKLPMFNTPFRFAPQQVYGRPDWDLILRAFYDYGRIVSVHREVYESNETLQAIGVGLELRIKNNFSLRFDYGVALEDIEDPITRQDNVSSGHKRIHTSCTFSF